MLRRRQDSRSVAATVVALLLAGFCNWSAAQPDRDLTQSEMAAVRGREKPCGPPCLPCAIDYENYRWECLSPYPSDNTCSQLSCVGPGGDCGGGKKWSNNWIEDYALVAASTYNEMLDTSTVLPCYATITCATGNVNNQRSCYAGGVGANDAFPGWAGTVGQGCLVPEIEEPTGCRPCSPNPTDPFNMVSKVKPKCVDCPFRDCSDS